MADKENSLSNTEHSWKGSTSSHQVLSLFNCKSKKEFVLLYEKCEGSVCGRNLYFYVLDKVKVAIQKSNIKSLKECCRAIAFMNLVQDEGTLQEYFLSDDNPIKNTTAIILACKHNQVDSLDYLINNESALINLSVHIGRRNILLTDEDEDCHNAFYYAIRTDNVVLLETLTCKWKRASTSVKLVQIVSRVYEELKLKNVSLSDDTEMFVEKIVINLRFFSKDTKKEKYSQSQNHIKDRIDILLENINYLCAQYHNEDVDERFLLVAKYIVQNIHILKKELKSTYIVLPWEEMEFSMVIFIKSMKLSGEMNLLYKSFLTKEKIITHLRNFASHVTKHKDLMQNIDFKKQSQLPSLKRDFVVADIISKSPEFIDLYRIYEDIRDITSLDIIHNYICLALSVEPTKNNEKLLIIRILQVIGEYLKNTLESPKLSNATSELLLCSLQKNTREIISDLRNSLSHAYSLSRRVVLEENTDINFFNCVLRDIKHIKEVIESILLKFKSKALKLLLSRLINTQNTDDLKKIVKSFQLETFCSFAMQCSPSEHSSSSNIYDNIKELCEKLRNTINKRTVYEENLFKQIRDVIDGENSAVHDTKMNYFTGLAMLNSMHSAIANLEMNVAYIHRNATRILTNLTTPMKPNINESIYDILIKIKICITQRINDEKYDEECRLICEILCIVEFEIGNIKWIEALNDKLNVNKFQESTAGRFISNRWNSVERKKNYLLEQRVELLKNILQNSNLNDQLNEKFQSYKRNKKLQAIIEMLVLDIFSILGDSEKRLTNNKTFMDDNFPMLVGKNLRDHLAHGNSSVDVLLSAVPNAVLLNAIILTNNDIITSDQNIGTLTPNSVSDLKEKIDREILDIETQNTLFTALSKGELDIVKSCIGKGADIHARNYYFQSSFHFAAMAPNLEIVKYIAHQKINHEIKDIDGQSPLHVACRYGRKETVEYLIESKKMCVNDPDNAGRTCLHLAAQHGYQDIVLTLLKHKASITCKDGTGISPVYYAIRNNHEEIAFILLQREQHVGINETGGFTALHVAAETDNLKLVNYLIKCKANVNAVSDIDSTPLHVAVEIGCLKVAKLLISAGANTNARNMNGFTPLHGAVETGRADIVKTLLQHGAMINAFDTNCNKTPLHFAAQFGRETIIRILLQNRVNLNIANEDGETALHVAAENGHQEVVKLLLNNNSPVNSETCNGSTPLHLSAMKGHTNVVQYLIEYGAKVNARMKCMTPLHLAACNGMTDCVELLISKGAYVNCIGYEGVTPLHLCSRNGHADTVNVLIVNGACVNTQCEMKMTPLHHAMHVKYDSNVAQMLLEKGAQVNATDIKSDTPLHFAALLGHRELVEMLIKCNADVNARNNLSLTPVHLAVGADHKDVVKVLIDNGSNVDESCYESLLLIAVQNNNKYIASALIHRGLSVSAACRVLTAAIFAGYKDLVNLFLKCETFDVNSSHHSDIPWLHLAVARRHRSIVQILLSKGADVNAVTALGNTPLHAAAESGDSEIVQILLEHEANINAKSADGSTPLHIASGIGHNDVVQVLLQYSANVDIKDKKNRTCLELAVAHGHLHIVKQCLGYQEMDINAKGNDCFTLLHIAAQSGHLEVTKYLCTCGANIKSKNNAGSKPIHITAREGHINILDFYLGCKVSIDDRGTADQTLLHYAAAGNQTDVTKYLIQLNADVNIPDKSGSKPLHIAAFLGHKDIIKILLENGAYYDATNNFYQKPAEMTQNANVLSIFTLNEEYFKSVRLGNRTMVEKCINSGAIVNVKNANNASPLHYASCKGYYEVVGVLLKHKANPNIIGKGGCTPLHYASKFSYVEIVKCLLLHGAVYDAKNINQKIPLDFAVHKEIINLLNLVDQSFRNVQNGNPKVISDLMNNKAEDLVKCVMNARNSEKKSLIVSAIHNKFPLVDELKEILQDDIATRLRMVNACFLQANYQKAAGILTEILEERKKIFGLDNPSTWDIEKQIALALYKQNEYQSSLIKLEEIFKNQKETLGRCSDDTLSTQSYIALIFHRLGRNEEALSIFEHVYQEQNKVLQRNHPDILATGMHMALVLDKLGRFEEALDISNELFEKRKRTLGNCHPETLCVQNNIAMILNNSGRYDEALEVYHMVYGSRKVVLGPSHPDTLRTLHNSANVLFDKGKIYEAVELFKDVYQQQKVALGAYHKDSLDTQFNLAQMYIKQGKYRSALKIYTETLDKRTGILGPNHPEILHTVMFRNKLKSLLQKAGVNTTFCTADTKVDIFDAAYNGDEKVIQTYLQNGMHINCKNQDGVTPLHLAVSNSHERIVLLLLQNDADITMVTPKGNTALHIAVSKGFQKIATMLLNYAKQAKVSKLSDFVNAKTYTNGTTALHVAKDVQLVKLLLKYGAFYNIENKAGKTPKDLSENPNIIKLLSLIDVLYEDAKSGNHDMINKLGNMATEERVAFINMRNHDDKSLMQVAIVNQHRTLAGKLLKTIK